MDRQRAEVTFKAGDVGKKSMVKALGALNGEEPVSVDYIRAFVNRGGASAPGMGAEVEGHRGKGVCKTYLVIEQPSSQRGLSSQSVSGSM